MDPKPRTPKLYYFGAKAEDNSSLLFEISCLSNLAKNTSKICCGLRSCIILSQGQVYEADYDSLLNNTYTPTPIPTSSFSDEEIVDIAAGNEHYLVVTVNGKVYSWGNGSSGQLGNGTLESMSTPTLIQSLLPYHIINVAAGDEHSIVLTDTGNSYTFGRGLEGQLGLGDSMLQSAPHLVKTLFGQKIVVIRANHNCSSFVSEEGNIYVCGDGTSGLLGQNDSKSSNIPISIKIPSRVKDSWLGWDHIMINTYSGEIFSCGSNVKGALGYPTKHLDSKKPKSVPIHHILTPPYLGGIVAQRGSIDLDNKTTPMPSISSPTKTTSVKVNSLVCGAHWSAVLSEGMAYVCGSFGFEPRFGVKFHLLNEFLPPESKVMKIWPHLQSAFILVEVPSAKDHVEVQIFTPQLNKVDTKSCLDYVGSQINRALYELAIDAQLGELQEKSVSAMLLPGPSILAWNKIVEIAKDLTQTDSPDFVLEQADDGIILHVPSSTLTRKIVKEGGHVCGVPLNPKGSGQLLCLKVYGPPAEIVHALEPLVDINKRSLFSISGVTVPQSTNN